MPLVTLPEFEPHKAQRELLERYRKRNVCCAGRRFGKTVLLIDVIIAQPGGALAGARGDGRQGLACAWYAPNDAYFTRVYKDIVRLYHPVIRSSATSPRPSIEFINNGRIDFWTLAQPMKCGRGNNYARVVIDEAAHAPHLQEAWEKTIAWTLADADGDAFFISTPNGLNFFHTLYKKAQRDGDYWSAYKAPSMSNPHLPDGWMEEQRTKMPDLVFSQEVLANFVTFGSGLIDQKMFRYGDYPQHERVVLGVDLAISEREGADYTAICAMCRDSEHGTVYIIAVERFRAPFHIVIEKIKTASARFKPVLIGIEQTQFQAAVVQELLRTTTLPVLGVRADRDKLTRFLPMLTRYERRMVVHHSDQVPNALEEELVAFPEGAHDDMVDALSIASHVLGRISSFSYTA
jgi:predicted phage terminase large subunit-like protein